MLPFLRGWSDVMFVHTDEMMRMPEVTNKVERFFVVGEHDLDDLSEIHVIWLGNAHS
jgi:hypothetical protein